MINSSPISQSSLSLFNLKSKTNSPIPQFKRSLTTASATCTSASSFYDILGISMGATSDEVKSAFRKLARVWHPDMATNDSSTDHYIKIHTAYSTLSDPTKRANYDRQIFRQHRSYTVLTASPSTVSSSPLYTRRNWETDQCW